MRNVEKIVIALKKAFIGHEVEISYNSTSTIYLLFVDNNYVGSFEDRFCEDDFDEIELTIKAPLKNINDFVNKGASESYGIIRGAVERGLEEWEKGSRANN